MLAAVADLGLASQQVAVIADLSSDITAAQSAGAVGILVPSRRTLRAEVREVPLVEWSLLDAVGLVLDQQRDTERRAPHPEVTGRIPAPRWAPAPAAGPDRRAGNADRRAPLVGPGSGAAATVERRTSTDTDRRRALRPYVH